MKESGIARFYRETAMSAEAARRIAETIVR